MMQHSDKNKGMTLVESVLALTLIAIVMVPLSTAFKVSLDSWKDNREFSSLVHEAHNVMFRLTTELKYATRIVEISSVGQYVNFKFQTKVVEDSSRDIEEIFYRHDTAADWLYRSTDDGVTYSIFAGHYSSDPVDVDTITYSPMRFDSSDGQIKSYTIPPYTLDDAVAVKIDLTIRTKAGKTIIVSSMAKMRNE